MDIELIMAIGKWIVIPICATVVAGIFFWKGLS